MKKQCSQKLFLIMNFGLVFNLLLFWSIRSMWSGIINIAGHPTPYILMAVLTIVTIVVSICTMYKKHPLALGILGCVLDVIFLGLQGYMLAMTQDSWMYFAREFFYGIVFLGGIALIIFLIFYSGEISFLHSKWMPPALGIVLLIAGFLVCFDVQLINGIEKTPVVYAVEDTYQITFTTKAKGEAWVVIDGVEYNDTYAGYRKSEETIHKITVPMEALDNADSYTVYTRAMYLRGPYCALQGATLSETYNWRGVNTTDGIQYYAFADNHLTTDATADTAGYWGDKLDFLVALGDTANWIDAKNELSLLLHLASDITKGEIPVLYARGNHETKGLVADEFHKYVGSKNSDYYYTFRMKNIWGIVLDVGEDHEDEHWEFSGMAKFDDYRDAQLAFLNEVIANADTEYNAEGVEYRIALCHIPLTFVKEDDPLKDQKFAWVERLNQMNLSLMLNGHRHELMFAEANQVAGTNLTVTESYNGTDKKANTYTMSDANFPTILVSRRAQSQLYSEDENVFGKHFIGVAASVEGDETILRFTNENGETVKTISPWFEGVEYGEEIRIKNK